jgi:hypothetical protein
MPISKRLRYEILRRDNHCCRYCGDAAPEVKLVIDHVTPVSLGGTDDPSNLVAACQPCNAGKAAATPDTALVDDVLNDSAMWDKAKAEATTGRRADKFAGFEDEIGEVEKAWAGWVCRDGAGVRHSVPKDENWKASVRIWLLRGLPPERMLELIGITMKKEDVTAANRWRYFAGCAWRTIEKIEADTERAYDEMKRECESPEPQPVNRYEEVRPSIEAILARLGDESTLEDAVGVARRFIALVTPHADEAYINPDYLTYATTWCYVMPDEDYATTLARWFLDDLGLEVGTL